MESTSTASALPSTGPWGSFASRLLEGVAAASAHCKEQRMMLAASERDDPETLATGVAPHHRVRWATTA